jgi:hypothetical protein
VRAAATPGAGRALRASEVETRDGYGSELSSTHERHGTANAAGNRAGAAGQLRTSERFLKVQPLASTVLFWPSGPVYSTVTLDLEGDRNN